MYFLLSEVHRCRLFLVKYNKTKFSKNIGTGIKKFRDRSMKSGFWIVTAFCQFCLRIRELCPIAWFFRKTFSWAIHKKSDFPEQEKKGPRKTLFQSSTALKPFQWLFLLLGLIDSRMVYKSFFSSRTQTFLLFPEHCVLIVRKPFDLWFTEQHFITNQFVEPHIISMTSLLNYMLVSLLSTMKTRRCQGAPLEYTLHSSVHMTRFNKVLMFLKAALNVVMVYLIPHSIKIHCCS